MTEQEWLDRTDPIPMLEFLRHNASERKLRLFAVACGQRILTLMPDVRGRLALQVADHFLKRTANARGLDKVETNAALASFNVRKGIAFDAAIAAKFVSTLETMNEEGSIQGAIGTAWSIAELASRWAAKAAARSRGYFLERLIQCQLLRDIFGNPFRPAPTSACLDPRWLTSDVVNLARTIYEERAVGRMPILADALMDAGCDNADILHHCRGAQPHVRGCWLVDLLLGKS